MWSLGGTAIVLALHLVFSLARGKCDRRPRWALLTKLIYLSTFASVLVLGVTSFYSVIDHGAMHGWFLLIHVASAGGFVVCLMLIALIWALPSRPCAGSNVRADDPLHETKSAARFGSITKLCFWLILISGVVTAGSMLLSMLPLMGTESLLQMITLHRYAGLVLVVSMLIHGYSVMLGRLGRG
jgi:hypothetical protein